MKVLQWSHHADKVLEDTFITAVLYKTNKRGRNLQSMEHSETALTFNNSLMRH